jgi:hypothetical protein
MKKSDLHKIVREAIKDVINETTMTTIVNYKDKSRSDQVLDIDPSDTNTINKLKSDPSVSGLTVGPKKLKEDEIDEMANVAVRYQLSPDANAANFAGKKSRIIAAMQATEEPMSKPDVASELGYDKQNPINADFMELVANGTIIPAGAQAAPRLNRPAAAAPEAGEEEEEVPAGEERPEGGVEGEMSDADIEASFAKMMGSGEEEPEEGEIETADISGDRISDEDYEAFMKYTDLENRLSKVKSDVLKAKRARPSIGDIADTPSSELQNLRDLKNRLQAKMDDLLAGSEYLKARQAKLNKKAQPEDTEDAESEEINEWAKNRMQFYAGIKK